MRGHVRFLSIWCAAALSVGAFAQESSSDSQLVDAMRQPGGLYDATPHTRSPEISVGISLNWWPQEIGFGGRYFHPLLPDGFLPELNDSLEIGGGLDFYPFVFSGLGGMELAVPLEARWTFHLTPALAVYGMFSLGLEIRLGGISLGPGYSNVDFWNSIGPGVIYQLSDALSVQAELSYHGLRGGLRLTF